MKPKQVNINLYPKQWEAFKLLEASAVTEVLYGGAAGGGKSHLGIFWQIQRRLKYAGTRGFIGRAALTNLTKYTVPAVHEMFEKMGLKLNYHYSYNGQHHQFNFFNGSRIDLIDLFAYPADPNFNNFGSSEFTDGFIEEAAEVTSKAAAIIKSRIRYKLNEHDLQPKILLTCNPDTGWLKSDFYLPFINGTLPAHRAFVPASASDNKSLPQSYIEALQQLPEMDRKRLLYGDWDYDQSNDAMFQYNDIQNAFDKTSGTGHYYITADIARLGKDRTVIGVWHGLTLVKVVELKQKRVNEVCDEIRKLQQEFGIATSRILADEDGIGGGVVDVLRCTGFHNGGAAKDSARYLNKKNECYFTLATYFEQAKIGIASGDKETIQKELQAIRREKPEGDSKLSVISKDKQKSILGGNSPDYADMLMMRMYYEVYPAKGIYAIGGF